MRPVFIKTKYNVVVNASNMFSFSIEKMERHGISGTTFTFKIYANGSGISEELVEVGNEELANALLLDILKNISTPNPTKPFNLIDIRKYDIEIPHAEGSNQ